VTREANQASSVAPRSSVNRSFDPPKKCGTAVFISPGGNVFTYGTRDGGARPLPCYNPAPLPHAASRTRTPHTPNIGRAVNIPANTDFPPESNIEFATSSDDRREDRAELERFLGEGGLVLPED
jgi:hypothetical protein